MQYTREIKSLSRHESWLHRFSLRKQLKNKRRPLIGPVFWQSNGHSKADPAFSVPSGWINGSILGLPNLSPNHRSWQKNSLSCDIFLLVVPGNCSAIAFFFFFLKNRISPRKPYKKLAVEVRWWPDVWDQLQEEHLVTHVLTFDYGCKHCIQWATETLTCQASLKEATTVSKFSHQNIIICSRKIFNLS